MSTLSPSDRLADLVLALIQTDELVIEWPKVDCLDCARGMPDDLIPDRARYADLARGFVYAFAGREELCEGPYKLPAKLLKYAIREGQRCALPTE